MNDAERFALLGTYRTPRFRVGQRVRCLVRGEVKITGMTDAPIPWPIGKGGRGRHSLVVYKGLARAVRRESEQAICHWFGVRTTTVWKWRQALGVPRATPGTSRLHSKYARSDPRMAAGRRKGQAKAGDPERRRKIAEARRGKPRPPHVVEAVRAAHLGTHHTRAARRKMSQTHKRRGTLVPGTIVWTPEEDKLLRTLSTAEVAERTGRSVGGVRYRRRKLGFPDGRRKQ
jgi:hypothetical protein